jgi:hypothetical protein
MKAIPTIRGCGTRVRGAVYIESGLSSGGLPLESFLICPPTLIDTKRLGITPVGTKFLVRDGVNHVIDWVGSEGYPNVSDFTEEVRKFGLSRRISRSVDFSKLTPDSRILLVHSRAYVTNFEKYAACWILRETVSPGHPVPRCSKHVEGHDQKIPPSGCCGVWHQDVTGAAPIPGAGEPRLSTRRMPSFSYQCFSRPKDVVSGYLPAIFASFPITRIVAIKGEPGEDAENRKKLAATTVPTDLEDE